MMSIKQVVSFSIISMILWLTVASLVMAQDSPAPLYNTVKQKLLDGKQVFSASISSPDTLIAQERAASGVDYLWIEMQHSPLTYQETAAIIRAVKGLPAIPFIRVPDATESDIQKATDIGALGIIVPMCDTVEEAEAAVRYAKFPPYGRRSTGGMQARQIWEQDYRATANDNMLVIVMIETMEAVRNAPQIAAVPGVDVVFVGPSDLSYFSGLSQDDPQYVEILHQVRDAALNAGQFFGCTSSWADHEGFTFFLGARP
ncbi:HpcH/HpaI aldolase/citrate lyase family protein [Candidatus Latescibacterota bacterium]